MHNKARTTGATERQDNESRLQNLLDGTITIYQEGDTYHIVARFGGKVYKARSQSQARATLYAREWLQLNMQGGMY